MKPQRKTLDVDAVFDIETEGWSTYVVGGIRTIHGNTLYRHDNQDGLVNAILAVKGNVWAHNGGKFDVLWFLDIALKRGLRVECVSAGSRVVCARIGDTVIRDSFALAPMPLRELAKIAGGIKTETGLSCVCGNDCGGYCSIKRDMAAEDYNRLSSYLHNDLEVTFNAIKGLIAFAGNNDIDIAGTVGASGWSTLSRRLGIERCRWRGLMNAYRFVRMGYYGGRVQVLRTESQAGFRYDINSAYPFALTRQRLPIGNAVWIDGHAASKEYSNGKEGIYHATVTVKDCFLPPLPHRTDTRLIYPVGCFSGHWTGNELRYACDRGASINTIHSGIVWRSAEPLLSEFFDWLYGIRQSAIKSYGKDSAQAQWSKWLLNSITGKFAQSPETDKIVINPDNPESLACNASFNCRGGLLHHTEAARCCEHQCTGACGQWHALDKWERIYCGTFYRIPDCGYIEWSSYLTAFVRCYWHAAAENDGQSLVYGDTDSRFTEREQVFRVGTDIGEWKFEGTYNRFEALGPKLYRYGDSAGRITIRAKGIPVKGDMHARWESMKRGESQALTTGVLSLRSAVAEMNRGKVSSLFSRVDRARSLHLPVDSVGDRILVDGGPTTRPPHISEVDKLL